MMTLQRPVNLIPADTQFRIKAYISDDKYMHVPMADGLYQFSAYILDYAHMQDLEQKIVMSLEKTRDSLRS